MTQEEKQLLLVDLCARLPYGVILSVTLKDKYDDIVNRNIELTEYNLGYITKASNWQEYKPYLRPMSSITEEEKLLFYQNTLRFNEETGYSEYTYKSIDFLNAHHFDFRNLIGRGLAIEVTEENNPYKE